MFLYRFEYRDAYLHNPVAHYREAISVAEILSARSIVELSQCLCAHL